MKGTIYSSPMVLVTQETKSGWFKNLIPSLKELIYKPRCAE